ncbi:MAG: hypothetical protein Q8R08_04610 [bacterium]|nr:hypothetical protein [bacterium]
MIEYKTALGYLSVLIALISYVFYFRGIFIGKVKPHAFSWFLWSLTTTTVFFAQVVKGGGPGAWVTGFTAFACLIIFFLALSKGSREFRKWDWVFLLSAFLSLLLWWFTRDPTLSVILITITDALASGPTILKGYYKPFEEGVSLFALAFLKFILALFALENYTLATWLYPASLVLTNGVITLVILTRRKFYTTSSLK